MDAEALQHWMCCFVLKVQKKDGMPYPLDSLHYTACGVLQFLRLKGKPQVNFFRDKEFAELQMVLDSELEESRNSPERTKAQELSNTSC